jgi:hypothetical protein
MKKKSKEIRDMLIDILNYVYRKRRFSKMWYQPPIESRDMGWLYGEAIILLDKERDIWAKEQSKLKK